MKIVITGCTGFVGREIVPQLLDAGAELLLIGRDVDRIRVMYPGVPAASYSELADRGRGFDMLTHLAVLNNDAVAPLETFRAVNVQGVLDTLAASQAAGITRFVHFSSLHALDAANKSPYACSKREAAVAVADARVDAVTVFLAAVYGRNWAGKLAALNRFPHWASRSLFTAISAFKPVVDAKKISDFLLAGAPAAVYGETCLYDDKDENPVFRLGKRIVELLFALGMLAAFWWLFAILWIGVRVQSAGPGIFAQVRVGRGGRHFTCYKFRTMVVGTKQSGTHEVAVTAVTSVGRFLRGTKLDELPQVWNILRNEMSLVGPRPCLPVQAELVGLRTEAGVYRIKPGITGYAQIHDIDMSDPVRLTVYDARYSALRSLLLDCKILLATFLGRGRGDRTAQ